MHRATEPLSGKSTVVGVFGDPVSHSLSPQMHNRAFAHLGLDWVYVPFHVRAERLGEAVRGVRALGLAGVNVTVPHKISVIEHLDRIDEEAEWIGAVNTIVHRDGLLCGYNTDGRGFVRSLEDETGRSPKGAEIVVIGAGGAAQALCFSLARAGAAAMTIVNRTVARAEALAQRIAGTVGGDAKLRLDTAPLDAAEPKLRAALARADILVHATSAGMHPHDSEPPVVDASLLSPHTLVCDIVYTPRETALIKAARSAGCQVLTGEGMLAYQGAIAFELWTGREAPAELMLETLRSLLEARARR